jgi:hypothetical protein
LLSVAAWAFPDRVAAHAKNHGEKVYQKSHACFGEHLPIKRPAINTAAIADAAARVRPTATSYRDTVRLNATLNREFIESSFCASYLINVMTYYPD